MYTIGTVVRRFAAAALGSLLAALAVWAGGVAGSHARGEAASAVQTVSAAPAAALAITLTGGPTTVGGGTPVTLTAQASEVPSGLLGIVIKGDHGSGTFCGGTATCTLTVRWPAGAYVGDSETFTALISEKSLYDVRAQSNSVTITWKWGISLSASTYKVSPGDQVTLTANAGNSVDDTPYTLDIVDMRGNVNDPNWYIQRCGGATCVATVSNRDTGDVKYRAIIRQKYPSANVAMTDELTISWANPTFTLTPSALSPVGGGAPVTLTAKYEGTAPPPVLLGIAIIGDRGEGVLNFCAGVFTCTATVRYPYGPYVGDSETFTAVISESKGTGVQLTSNPVTITWKWHIGLAASQNTVPAGTVVTLTAKSESVDNVPYHILIQDMAGNLLDPNYYVQRCKGDTCVAAVSRATPSSVRYRAAIRDAWDGSNATISTTDPVTVTWGDGSAPSPNTGSAPRPATPAHGTALPAMSAVTLTWELPAGTTQYQLQLVPYNGDGPSINLIRNAESSFTIPAPPNWYVLLPGMTYTWRVRATDKATSVSESDPSWGPWSPSSTFTTPAPSADSVRASVPPLGATTPNLTPTLTWSDSNPYIFYYEIQLSTDDQFRTDPNTAVAAVYWNLIHGGQTQPVNSWRVPNDYPLEPGMRYYWRVRPRVQGNGTPVSWAQPFFFTTPGGATPPPAPAPGANLALGKPAANSSPYGPVGSCGTLDAGKAVDGNTDGDVFRCSVSVTDEDAQAWWQVDLQGSYAIDRIVVWNRTDTAAERLSNFDVLVSSDGSSWASVYYNPGAAGTTTTISGVTKTGRYVKVQLRGRNFLQLAEVQVFGR